MTGLSLVSTWNQDAAAWPWCRWAASLLPKPLSEAGDHETMVRAGSRTSSLTFYLAVMATTHRIQTSPSAILVQLPDEWNYCWHSSGLAAREQLHLSSHACFNTPSKHCMENLCDTLAVVLASTEYSENWGELAIPFSVSLCCSCKSPNIHPWLSNILPAVAAVQYMPYMTPCGTFDSPTHYIIYYVPRNLRRFS